MNGKIYAILDYKTKEVKYIGQTIQDIERRYKDHINKIKNFDRPLYRWMKENKSEVICLEENIPNIKELNEKEIKYISEYDNLLNIEIGGHHKIGNRDRDFKIEVNGKFYKSEKYIREEYGIYSIRKYNVGDKKYIIKELPSRCGVYVDGLLHENIKEACLAYGYTHRTNFLTGNLKYIGTKNYRKSYEYVSKKIQS